VAIFPAERIIGLDPQSGLRQRLEEFAEPTFVTRPFDESFTLDEFLITRTDFSNQAVEATRSAQRQ